MDRILKEQLQILRDLYQVLGACLEGALLVLMWNGADAQRVDIGKHPIQEVIL